jgi:hypothetical protein
MRHTHVHKRPHVCWRKKHHRGGQDIRDLQSLLTAMSLKAGEQEF